MTTALDRKTIETIKRAKEVQREVESLNEEDIDSSAPCTTWLRLGGILGLFTRKDGQCKNEAVWFCRFPCCNQGIYTCNKHLGNGYPWICVDCKGRHYKATDLSWRKIRR